MHEVRRAGRFGPVGGGLVAVGAVVLAAAGFWFFVAHSMSEQVAPSRVGMRIDGGKVTVRAAQCPHERVLRVEVRDDASERLVWNAEGPRTAQGRGGLLALWKADDYEKPAAGTRPAELPRRLDVLVDYSDGGIGAVFDTAAVQAARMPAGSYWTPDGVRTAQELDRLVPCDGATAAAP
ncbi:hypothetical protein ACWGIN_06030 [Streptomyces sp. NPDC054861]